MKFGNYDDEGHGRKKNSGLVADRSALKLMQNAF